MVSVCFVVVKNDTVDICRSPWLIISISHKCPVGLSSWKGHGSKAPSLPWKNHWLSCLSSAVNLNVLLLPLIHSTPKHLNNHIYCPSISALEMHLFASLLYENEEGFATIQCRQRQCIDECLQVQQMSQGAAKFRIASDHAGILWKFINQGRDQVEIDRHLQWKS